MTRFIFCTKCLGNLANDYIALHKIRCVTASLLVSSYSQN